MERLSKFLTDNGYVAPETHIQRMFNGDYMIGALQKAWRAWQARAALAAQQTEDKT